MAALLAVPLCAANGLAQSTKPAGDADKAKDAARRRAMLAAGRAGFCQVHYYFQRPEDETAQNPQAAIRPMGTIGQAFINRRMYMLAAGLLLDSAGHVLVEDLGIEEKYIDHIDVVLPDGRTFKAVPDRILDRCPAVILSIQDRPANLAGPDYAKDATIRAGDDLYVVGVDQVGRDWRLQIAGLGPIYDFAGKDDTPVRYGGGGGGSALGELAELGLLGPSASMLKLARSEVVGDPPEMLCDGAGRPIGVATSVGLDPRQEHLDWQVARLLGGPHLTYEQLAQDAEKAGKAFDAKIHECKILFRQEGQDTGRQGGYGMANRGPKEVKTYGLAISDKRLLIPQAIDRRMAARIEGIEITVGDKKLSGEFVGALAELAAFFIDVKQGSLPESANFAAGMKHTPKVELFYTLEPEEKFGGKHFDLLPNRWFSEDRGYRNAYFVRPAAPAAPGAWIVDRSLNLIGVYTRQRIEGEDLQGFGGATNVGFSSRGENLRIFWADELVPFVTNPAAHFDKNIKYKTEEEEKRVVWLGVEFDSVSQEIARQLKIERQTKDGTIGLMVTRVYEGSPAAKLGVKNGDVLLRIKTPKLPEPVELEAGLAAELSERLREKDAPWPSQQNYLTMLLMAVGEGEKIDLTYLSDGKEATKTVAIEMGPPDFASAEKWKSQELGITVKDLTYEVRAALKLPPDKSGVVVANVEEGRPAAVAGIEVYQLITEMDGQPVAARAKEFGKRLEQVKAAGKESVRLTVEDKTETNIRDLNISELNAKGDAGQERPGPKGDDNAPGEPAQSPF